MAFQPHYQSQVKALVVGIHEELGFPYDVELDYDLENPAQYYQQAGGAFYVLLKGEDVIGTVAIKIQSLTQAELKRMYLLPEYRGRGCGAQLLEQALTFCVKYGFKTCILDTTTKQSAALKLYERYGFSIERRASNTLFLSKDLR